MMNLTTTDLETVHGGCHTPPCHKPPCHKPPCHKPPCHKPPQPNGGNWPVDFGDIWSWNPMPTFPTYSATP